MRKRILLLSAILSSQVVAEVKYSDLLLDPDNVELNEQFIEDMGRGMTALEFLSGLAFSLPGLCHPDYSSNDLMGLPICETHSLQIRVVPIEDE